MSAKKNRAVFFVDEDSARRVAHIIGDTGAHAMALAELERRRAAGEKLMLCRSADGTPMLLIIPIADLGEAPA